MFIDQLKDILCIDFENKIIVKDIDNIIVNSGSLSYFENNNWKVYYYNDEEMFRYEYELKIKANNSNKYLVIANSDLYIPYDIIKNMYFVDISFNNLFPKLNPYILRNTSLLNFDLLSIAYENLYEGDLKEEETKEFLSKEIYSNDTITTLVNNSINVINKTLDSKLDYNQWFYIIKQLANIKSLILQSNTKLELDEIQSKINDMFEEYILTKYNMLSSLPYFKGPILLNKVLDYILIKRNNNAKIALIIMDGMSVIDWENLRSCIDGYDFDTKYSFAMIPTITSISRQCLLSGKLPVELDNPFSLSQEKSLFYEKCMELGFSRNEIEYHKGYDFSIASNTKIVCLIFNDIDDFVHMQTRGDEGMFQDVMHLAKTQKFQRILNKLSQNGFKVYITSDHGNTKCKGIGRVFNTGVELESKCQKALIYKDYIYINKTKQIYNLIEYPKYYLPKNLQYLLCKQKDAFEVNGKEIYTHGGVTIEETIVPFIEVKEK